MARKFINLVNPKVYFFEPYICIIIQRIIQTNGDKQIRIKIKQRQSSAAITNRHSHFQAWVSIKTQGAMQENYHQQSLELRRMESRQ